MSARRSFTISTDLAVGAPELWEHALSFEGVNYELMPLMRMAPPPGLDLAGLDESALGAPLGRCWIFALGVLPVDWDDLVVEEAERCRRFLERSSMATQRVWTHERTLSPLPDWGCRLTDTLGWEPRFAGAGAVFAGVVPVLFRHRHRRLIRRFGRRVPH